jgi:FkbM family methyltransferase
MKYKKSEILVGAIKRPDLVIRYLKGKIPSEFDLDEVSEFVTRPDAVIVEAGAFDGKDTAVFAKHWPDGHVYAFEPLPVLAQKVRSNTAGLKNVSLFELALGIDDSPTVELFSFDDQRDLHGSSSLLRPGDHLKIAPEIKFNARVVVSAITADTWFESVGSPKIDLLWLAHTETIHIEVSRKPLYSGGVTYREIKRFLEDQGFKQKRLRMPVRSGNAIFAR